jgi:pyruvate/2-oxoglutarate dehydrogenase complex dihydrolipoamide dehydrogenase (E3) component
MHAVLCAALGVSAQAKNILIAVGGQPHKLPIPGAELTITSDEALELAERPKKITGQQPYLRIHI